MPEMGMEALGGNLSGVLQPQAQETLFERPALPVEVLLRRLIHPHHKKAVALEYYPATEKRTGRPLSGIPLEKHVAQAVTNLDRMLEGHRPITVKLLECVMHAVPGAAVAVAHYYADRAGCERGAPKIEAMRLAEEILAISASLKRSDEERDAALRRLDVLQGYVQQIQGARR